MISSMKPEVHSHDTRFLTNRRQKYVAVTKPRQLILFAESMARYCRVHTTRVSILCGHNVVLKVKSGGTRAL